MCQLSGISFPRPGPQYSTISEHGGTQAHYFAESWKWSMSAAQEYRYHAAECLRLAERHPQDRDRWLAMAAQWTALAEALEKRTAAPD